MKWVDFLCFFIFIPSLVYGSGAYSYRMPKGKMDPQALTVIGVYQKHQIEEGETMLDIARYYDLGYQELMLLHSQIDPWLPSVGKTIIIPTRWVLPFFYKKGIILNIPEFRLFLYLPKQGLVKTYPVGIGVQESPTPFGNFKVLDKKTNPTWEIPPGLRDNYQGRTFIPPGPDNPLGSFWIGLGNGYGIHGTNSPWGIGRLVSHGCIRLYPEDIKELFRLVKIGMPVKIIYQPVKFGFEKGRIYVEVHPDIYNKIGNLTKYGIEKAISLGLGEKINFSFLHQALKEKKGIPVDITRRSTNQ